MEILPEASGILMCVCIPSSRLFPENVCLASVYDLDRVKYESLAGDFLHNTVPF